jgi:hypothetical protein
MKTDPATESLAQKQDLTDPGRYQNYWKQPFRDRIFSALAVANEVIKQRQDHGPGVKLDSDERKAEHFPAFSRFSAIFASNRKTALERQNGAVSRFRGISQLWPATSIISQFTSARRR